jgi:hypothetical protein
MGNEDIDVSDCPEITPEMFAKSVICWDLPVAKTRLK